MTVSMTRKEFKRQLMYFKFRDYLKLIWFHPVVYLPFQPLLTERFLRVTTRLILNTSPKL